MNPLYEAVSLMTKEEVRAFKLFSQKVNTAGPRKDLELFDQIRKSGDDFDDDAAYNRIYPGTSKNTFHRLKSRLLHDINRSMVDLHLENNDILRLWHFLSVVEYYFSKSHYELAHWFLRKAEKVAEKLGNLEALDIILNEYIRLSHQVVYINPEEFIIRRKANQEELRRIRELDDILAAATYRAKVSQTYAGSGGELIRMLEATVREFAQDHATGKNPALRIKLFQAVSKILLDKRDYRTLEIYVKETYEGFENDGVFTRSNHETRLQMLTYIANALHKNQKYDESLRYAELLGRSMMEFDSFLQDKYMFFYYNVLMINYFELNLDKAITLLEEMRANEKIMETPFYVLFIDMNLALAWNQKKNYKKAIRYVVQSSMLDAYKSAATGMKLRIATAEAMIRYKLKEYEVLQQRLRQIANEFSEELGTNEYNRESALLGLLGAMNESIDLKKDEKLLAKIQKFTLEGVTEDQRDAELIDYNEFLLETIAT